MKSQLMGIINMPFIENIDLFLFSFYNKSVEKEPVYYGILP